MRDMGEEFFKRDEGYSNKISDSQTYFDLVENLTNKIFFNLNNNDIEIDFQTS
jgi:hypothetical protein